MLNCADSLDSESILDQTDLISLLVTFVQPLDDGAGKGWALEAKINPLTGGTVFDLALPAMFGLAGILSATAKAGLLLAEIYVANHTGDSAWGQHCCGDFCEHFHKRISIPK